MRSRSMWNRALTLAAGVAVTAFVLAGCAGDPTVPIETPPQVEADLPAETQAQLEDAVTLAMAASGSSGAIVGVWVPWSGTWVTGLGTQTPTSATPVTADMAFRVGPITRLMTCDVLYGLAADGVVELDGDVTDYLTPAPNLTGITLLELCNGTSGIGDSGSRLVAQTVSNPAREWDPRYIASFGLSKDRGAKGTYAGSDAGYLVLGIALERASGKSAAALIDEYVTTPLDLGATALPGSAAAAPGPGAALTGTYTLPGEDGALNCAEPIDITTSSASIGFTNAGATSTITDLGRYAQALASDALHRDGQPDRWANPLPASASAPTWYAATGGAMLAGSLVGQHGSAPGYITGMYADPETGMTVAVVLNNSTASAGIGAYLAWQLAAIASKAPATGGATAPEFGLPWTAEQYGESIAAAAICPLPVAEPAAE